MAIYRTIGEKGTELTGYPSVSTYEDYTTDKSRPLRGVFMDWLYEHHGIITFSTELWNAWVRAGEKLFDGADRVEIGPCDDESSMELVTGRPREDAGHLEGLGSGAPGWMFRPAEGTRRKKVEWVVRASSGTKVLVRASSPRAREAKEEIRLGS